MLHRSKGRLRKRNYIIFSIINTNLDLDLVDFFTLEDVLTGIDFTESSESSLQPVKLITSLLLLLLPPSPPPPFTLEPEDSRKNT